MSDLWARVDDVLQTRSPFEPHRTPAGFVGLTIALAAFPAAWLAGLTTPIAVVAAAVLAVGIWIVSGPVVTVAAIHILFVAATDGSAIAPAAVTGGPIFVAPIAALSLAGLLLGSVVLLASQHETIGRLLALTLIGTLTLAVPTVLAAAVWGSIAAAILTLAVSAAIAAYGIHRYQLVTTVFDHAPDS